MTNLVGKYTIHLGYDWKITKVDGNTIYIMDVCQQIDKISLDDLDLVD
jgi:hypothetical protein